MSLSFGIAMVPAIETLDRNRELVRAADGEEALSVDLDVGQVELLAREVVPSVRAG